MTTENKETKFDVRKVPEYNGGHIETGTEASRRESPTKLDLNSIYGITGKTVRPTIQFVPGKQDTTESRLSDVREQMTFTRAKKTMRRTGWYFTEPYAPCGSAIASPFSAKPSGVDEIVGKIKEVFGA